MGHLSEHDQFLAAYQAWDEKTEAHRARIRAALQGGPCDYDAAIVEVVERRALQDVFLEKSKPSAHSRQSRV